MKANFKILTSILLVSAIVLLLLGYVVKGEAKPILLLVGTGLVIALVVEVVLYLINPKFFKNKIDY